MGDEEGYGYTHRWFYPSTRQEHVKMGDFFDFTRQITRQKASFDPSGRKRGAEK